MAKGKKRVPAKLQRPVFLLILPGQIAMSLNYGWPPLIYVGLFEMSITFALWLTALQLTASAARIGILIYITPSFSLLILKTVVEEQIHPATFIGLALIIGSILFQSWTTRRKAAAQ